MAWGNLWYKTPQPDTPGSDALLIREIGVGQAAYCYVPGPAETGAQGASLRLTAPRTMLVLDPNVLDDTPIPNTVTIVISLEVGGVSPQSLLNATNLLAAVGADPFLALTHRGDVLLNMTAGLSAGTGGMIKAVGLYR